MDNEDWVAALKAHALNEHAVHPMSVQAADKLRLVAEIERLRAGNGLDYRSMFVRYMAAVIDATGVPYYGRNAYYRIFSEAELTALDAIDLDARAFDLKTEHVTRKDMRVGGVMTSCQTTKQ